MQHDLNPSADNKRKKSPRGVSLESILPDGAKRMRSKKPVRVYDVDAQPSPRKRVRKPPNRKRNRHSMAAGDSEPIFVNAEGDQSSDLVQHLNITAADERRKYLLQRLRVIDVQKAKIKAGKGTSGPTNKETSVSKRKNHPIVPELDISSITAHDAHEDMSHIGARLQGFSSPMSTAASTFTTSPALSEGSQDGLKRRASRSRTPSVLLRRLPGELATDFKPLAISQCKRLAFCKKLVSEMLKDHASQPFSAPVTDLWPIESIPRYFDVITTPMDLGTIKRKLDTGEYVTEDGAISGKHFNVMSFDNDVKQVFRNAMIYNSAGDALYESAKRLLEGFELDMMKIPRAEGKRPAKRVKRKSKVAAKRVKSKPGSAKTQKTSPTKIKAEKKKKASSKANVNTSPVTPQSSLPTNMTVRQLKDHVAELRRHRQFLEMAAASPVTSPTHDHTHLALMYASPMSATEKTNLTENIAKLPVDKIDKLVTIIKTSKQQGLNFGQEGELELDIDKFDNKLLRDLELYVESALGVERKGKNKTSQLETEYRTVEEVDTAIKAAEERVSEVKSSKASLKRERSFYDMQDSSSDSSSESESESDDSDSESSGSDSD